MKTYEVYKIEAVNLSKFMRYVAKISARIIATKSVRGGFRVCIAYK